MFHDYDDPNDLPFEDFDERDDLGTYLQAEYDDRPYGFGLEPFNGREGRTVAVGQNLSHAVMVAQVDEQHAAVVADAVAPAGKPGGFTDVLGAQGAAGVGAIAVHGGGHLGNVIPYGNRAKRRFRGHFTRRRSRIP